MADVLRDEGPQDGTVKALQQTLLRLMRSRFDKIPIATETTVRATQNLNQLNAWLNGILTATTLDDMGIDPSH